MVTATGETKTIAEDAALKDQDSRQEKSGSTSQETRTYNEDEYRKGISDALAEQGRKHKIALTAAERKSQEKANQTLTDLQAERDELQTIIEDLGKDDEDKSRLSQLLKEKKAEITTLKQKNEKWEGDIADAKAYKLTKACAVVAGEFAGDTGRLERLAKRDKSVLDAETEEERIEAIREIATEIFPPKTAATVKETPRKTDSDVTTGATKGKLPTLEELRASSPENTEKKIKSGEWILPGWMV